MKIKMYNDSAKAFKDLLSGTVFQVMGETDVLMKVIDRNEKTDSAVNLSTNRMVYINAYDLCVPLDAQIIVYGELH